MTATHLFALCDPPLDNIGSQLVHNGLFVLFTSISPCRTASDDPDVRTKQGILFLVVVAVVVPVGDVTEVTHVDDDRFLCGVVTYRSS